jgi:hypothetical protein
VEDADNYSGASDGYVDLSRSGYPLFASLFCCPVERRTEGVSLTVVLLNIYSSGGNPMKYVFRPPAREPYIHPAIKWSYDVSDLEQTYIWLGVSFDVKLIPQLSGCSWRVYLNTEDSGHTVVLANSRDADPRLFVIELPTGWHKSLKRPGRWEWAITTLINSFVRERGGWELFRD